MKAYFWKDPANHYHYLSVSTDCAVVKLQDERLAQEGLSVVGFNIRGPALERAKQVYKAAQQGLEDLRKVTKLAWEEL